MKNNLRKRLTELEAKLLGLELKPNEKGRVTARYYLTKEQWKIISAERSLSVEEKTETKPNDYKTKRLVMSAWDNDGFMMDIDAYCKEYGLPRADITSYKLITHTGTPHYNVVFKEQIGFTEETFDFKGIIEKYIKPIESKVVITHNGIKDFNTLTITDVHVGMNPDPDHNTMYKGDWNKEELLKAADIVIEKTIREQDSNILYIDELGDLLDGFNAQTTRGGHDLPQNMTNEQCFDAALEFKLKILYGLVGHYEELHFNNICNDNHSGAFGYFVNESFKQIAEVQFGHVKVTNHRKFINHYYVNDICFIISHGKDDKSLKFGFKPHLDLKGADKIDQYCKQNKIYKKAELVIFKKGDSHQELFDMCTSDDFYYFNYPALSPSSNWIKNNFKLGRRGFVNESFEGLNITLKPHFIK